MKKLLYVLFAFVLCLGMNSCKKEAAPKDDAAETEKAAVEEKEADPPSMADIVAKAKAEGANWTVDEWKEQFKAMALATKPIMLKMAEALEMFEKDSTKGAELQEAMEKIKADYPDFEKLAKEFDTIAEGTESGKIVANDEVWGKNMMEELGIPDL
jgi:hypothetical protein